MHRRDFVKGAALTGAALIGGVIAMAQNRPVTPDRQFRRRLRRLAAPTTESQVPKKSAGKTGLTLSALGIGGFHLGTATDQNVATTIVNRALDAGVNFFDNAWEYHEGESEIRLGEALKGKRDKAIVMTKVCTHGRGKDVAMRMLEESLRRLQTDYLDVWQIHEVIYYNDPDLIFAPGGAAEALLDAKKQGKVRFIGFTGHKDPPSICGCSRTIFRSIPSRCRSIASTPHSAASRPRSCPKPIAAKLAVFGMKSLGGGGEMVTRGAITPEEGLRYAMSLPVATTISGIDSLNVLEQNLAVARDFKPMSDSEMTALRERCRALAGDGHLERFKTTMLYDGDIGREQHGYPSSKEVPL